MITTILSSLILILLICFNAVIIRAEREPLQADHLKMQKLWHALGLALRASVVLQAYLIAGTWPAVIVAAITLSTWDILYNLITSKGKKVFGLGTTARADILRTKVLAWIKLIWTKIVGKK